VLNAPIRVFIAAENRLLREALFRVFKSEKGVRVVGQAGHCSEAAQQMMNVRPDVFLLNPASPSLSDLDDLQEFHRGLPRLKIVLFGMTEDEELFLEAVRQRAVGYILKDACTPDLVAVVRTVARGGAVCPPRLCLLVFNCVAKQRITLMPALRLHMQLGLTRRERELVPMIAKGLTNKEIAVLLNISEQTVKNHIHRMIQKAGGSTRLEIVDRCQLPEYVMDVKARRRSGASQVPGGV
jgi:DNA-binding NarL/FixJ family response regulator